MTIYRAPELFERRHMISWYLLAFAAGATNAGGFFACQRFISHVTGTVTRIGMDVESMVLTLDYAMVLGSFMLGAAASVLFLQQRARRGKEQRPWLPLFLVAGILLSVAVLGQRGHFGPFGETVETFRDFVLLWVLSFAMGLQNAVVSTATGLAVRTTHMTGLSTDLAVTLAALPSSEGEERRMALLSVLLRGGKLLAFTGGAALMLPLSRSLHYGCFIVPAIAIVTAVLRSFAPAAWRDFWSATPTPAEHTEA